MLRTCSIDPKDAQRILMGSSGKLGPMDFAQGLVAIVAVSVVLSLLSLFPGMGVLVGLLNLIVGLALAYAWVCIFSKRFHDAGQSGWMTVAAIVVAIVISAVVVLILSPVFGSMDYGNMASARSMGSGLVFRNMIVSVITNGALGYYMYKLKPVML